MYDIVNVKSNRYAFVALLAPLFLVLAIAFAAGGCRRDVPYAPPHLHDLGGGDLTPSPADLTPNAAADLDPGTVADLGPSATPDLAPTCGGDQQSCCVPGYQCIPSDSCIYTNKTTGTCAPVSCGGKNEVCCMDPSKRCGSGLECNSGFCVDKSCDDLPTTCGKIEGGQVGQSGLQLVVGGVMVTFNDWVKSGLDYDPGSTSPWQNPNGNSGPNVHGISTVTFCVQ